MMSYMDVYLDLYIKVAFFAFAQKIKIERLLKSNPIQLIILQLGQPYKITSLVEVLKIVAN